MGDMESEDYAARLGELNAAGPDGFTRRTSTMPTRQVTITDSAGQVSSFGRPPRDALTIEERTSLSDLEDVWDAQAIEASHGDILRRLHVIEEKLGIHHGSD